MTPTAKPGAFEIDVEDVVQIWPQRRDRWLFIVIPDQYTEHLNDIFDKHPRGFRSVPATASIAGAEWETALFRYRDGSWTLPLKSSIRKKHHLEEGSTVRAHVTVIPS